MGNKKDILIPRKGYAEFLKSVLDKSESFKRNEENNSLDNCFYFDYSSVIWT